MAKVTNVHFILDKSGSMGSVREATISGFNEYLDTLKKDGNTYTLTLSVFDTEVQTLEVNTPLSKVKKLTSENYIPSGMTALYDAVCVTLGKVKKSKAKNLVVIMTDGEENSSQEFTDKELKTMIKDLEKGKNWTFVFLGANQDSWMVGQKFGMKVGNVANYHASSKGMGETMRTVAHNTAMFAASTSNATEEYFTADDKERLENAK